MGHTVVGGSDGYMMEQAVIENDEFDGLLGVARQAARSWLIEDELDYGPQPTMDPILFEVMTVLTRAMHGMHVKLLTVKTAWAGRPVPPVTLQQGLSMTEQGATHADLRALYSAHGREYTAMVLGWMRTLGQQRAEQGNGVPMLLEPGDIICSPMAETWAVEVLAMEHGSDRSVIWYEGVGDGGMWPLEIGSYWPVKVLAWQ